MVASAQDDFLSTDRLPRREIDLSSIRRRVSNQRWWLIGPALAALIVSTIAVNVVTPRYTAETKILVENQEDFLPRTDKGDLAAPLPDDEAVQSQVQLVSSRDLARAAIRQLKLQGNPEFDPLANGIGPLTRVLVMLGLERDPMSVPPEDRILENYYERLTVFPVTKSRVLTIEFESEDPDLAARGANAVASLYLEIQSNAKRAAAHNAAESLKTMITALRGKAADAESKALAFRTQSGLVGGINNNSMSAQQLADMSTQLAQARSAEADAQARAKLIRDMIKAGRVAEIPDLANDQLIRRISDQRAGVQADIALQARTLLPGHPRMQELRAQLTDLDRQIRVAADKAARTLDNNASIAASRVDNLNAAISTQKDAIGATGGDQIKLNDLDLNAKLLKDQLELNTSKYQEAVARENAAATPADARVFSNAIAPQIPSFPKKLPIIAIATIAGALLSLGMLLAREFLSGRAFVAGEHDQVPVLVPARPFENPDADWIPVSERITGITPPATSVAAVAGTAETLRPPASAPAATDDRLAVARDPFLSTLDAVLALKQSEQSLRMLVCEASGETSSAALSVRFGRALARSFRTIAVDCGTTGGGVDDTVQALAGGRDVAGPVLRDLLAGDASFAEVIHRDRSSRLHYVSGVLSATEIAESEDGVVNALDALAETYDFVVMKGPAFDESPALVLVDHCDVLILHADANVAAERLDLLAARFGSASSGGPEVFRMVEMPGEAVDRQVGAAA